VEFLQAQYRDIQRNYDPSVVPFPKKRKIVLADGLLFLYPSPHSPNTPAG
jgi:hypothetical protein